MTENLSMAAAELVFWYAEMGVDVALGEEPADRFAASTANSASQSAPRRERPAGNPPVDAIEPKLASPVRAVTLPPQTPIPPAVNERAANDAAKAATTLDELRTALLNFDGCALSKTATQLVFAD